jgi:hypothetical protein
MMKVKRPAKSERRLFERYLFMHRAQFPSRGVIGGLKHEVFCNVGAVLLRNAIEAESIENLEHDSLACTENDVSICGLSNRFMVTDWRRRSSAGQLR